MHVTHNTINMFMYLVYINHSTLQKLMATQIIMNQQCIILAGLIILKQT